MKSYNVQTKHFNQVFYATDVNDLFQKLLEIFNTDYLKENVTIFELQNYQHYPPCTPCQPICPWTLGDVWCNSGEVLCYDGTNMVWQDGAASSVSLDDTTTTTASTYPDGTTVSYNMNTDELTASTPPPHDFPWTIAIVKLPWED